MSVYKTWRITLVVILMLGLAVLGGCSQGQQAENENVYKIGDATGDWGFPAPYLHYHRGPGYIRMSLIFDTLVWKDESGYIPALAKEWEYIEEENAYVFTLQEGVRWHDGEPFDAHDVSFTFNYIKEHPYIFVNSALVGQVEVLDDHKVKLVPVEPYAPFLANVVATMPVLPEHIYKDIEEPESYSDDRAAIGTGPYKYADYKKEMGTYLYTANEDYYLGTPTFDKIMFVKVNEQMAASALQKNEVDMVNIKSEMKDTLTKDGFNVIKSTYDSNVKLMINHQKEPFSHREFRQALAYTIDRQGLVDIVKRGYGVVGNMGVIPPDSPWFNESTEQYEYNPEKAQQLIESLGYTKQDGFYEKDGQVLSCELLVSEELNRDGEYIKNELEKAGIKVRLKGIEIKTLDVKVSEWNFDLALNSHGGLGGDPEMINNITIGNLPISIRFTQGNDLNSVLEGQVREMDETKRQDLLNRAQDILAQEVPVVTLYNQDFYFAFNDKANLYYTPGGLGVGVPIPQNKMIFVNRK